MREILEIAPGCEGWVKIYIPAGRLYRLHHHEELEINLVIRGTARYLVGKRRYDLAPGELVWLFPAQDHLLIDLSPDYEMWMAVFSRALIQRVCTTSTEVLLETDPAGLYCKRLASNCADRLVTLFMELADITGDTVRLNAGLAYLLLSAWAAHLSTDEAGLGWKIHPAVERAAYLLRDTPEPLGVEELADWVGLSPSWLSRLFKEQMGVSLVDYRNRQCIERFLHLYGQGNHISVTTAMLEAGFGSYAQFYRVFTATLGHGPAEYRRRLQRVRKLHRN